MTAATVSAAQSAKVSAEAAVKSARHAWAYCVAVLISLASLVVALFK